MEGTIDVQQVIRETQDERQRQQRLRERMERQRLRDEEERVLQEYHAADDKHEIVEKYPAIFARIKENRKRAQRIEQEERAILDRAMRRQGYAIRPGRDWPRYIRPRH